MKEGLIEYFLNDNKEWLGKKCQEMHSKFVKINENPHTNPVNTEEMIEIIVSMIHKFTKEQQIQIFQKLFKLLQAENNQANWQVLKKAIEGIVKIQEKAEIDLNSIEKRKVLDAMKKTVHDSNLGKVTIEPIQQVLNDPDDVLFIEVLKGMIEETPKDWSNAEAYQRVMNGVVQIAQRHLRNKDNHGVLKNLVNILVPFVSSSESFVREPVAATIAELINLVGAAEQEFVRGVVGVYISLWQSLPKEKGFVQTNLVKLAKMSNEFAHDIVKGLDSFVRVCSEIKLKTRAVDTMMDVLKLYKTLDPQFFRDIIVNLLIPLLNEGDEKIRYVISSEIPQLVQTAYGNDLQLTRDTIKTLLPLLQDNVVKDTAAKIIYNLAALHDTKGQEFIRDLIKTFLLSLKNEQQEFRLGTSDMIVDLIKRNDITDSQFIQDVINNLVPSLKSTNELIRLAEAEKIVWLMERGGIIDAQLVKGIFNLTVLISPDNQSQFLIKAAQLGAEVIKMGQITDAGLAKDVIKSVTSCFKNWYDDVRCVLINPLFGLMKMKGIITDTQFVKDFINATSYFESFNNRTYNNLGELITESGVSKDTQFARDLLILLISKMERNQVTWEVTAGFEEFVKILDEKCEIELARDIIKVLAQILTFSTIRFQPSVEKLMIEISKKRTASTLSFLREIMIALAPVFECPYERTLRFGLNIVEEILKIDGATTDKSFIQGCIVALSAIFKAPATPAKLSALNIIEKLINGPFDDSIIQNLIEALIRNIGDKNEDLRKLVSKIILNLVKMPQLAVHAIKSSSVLKDTSQFADFSSSFLTTLVQVNGIVNFELIQESISGLALSMQSPRIEIKLSASQRILELVKISQKEKDEEFCKNIVDKTWVPYLQDPDESTQLLSLDSISKIVEVSGSEGLVKHVVPIIAPLLNGDAIKEKTRKSAFTHLRNFSKKGGAEFAQDVLKNALIPLFLISEEESWRSLVLKNIGDLAKAIGKIDIEIAKTIIPILFALFKSKTYLILSSASASLIGLIKACQEIEYIRSLVNDLVSLVQEISGDDAKRCLLDTIGLLVKTIDTPGFDFIREVIVDVLIPYLHDVDLRSSATSWIPEMVGIAVKSDTQVPREISKILLPLLPNEKVKQSVSAAISQIVTKYDAKDEQFIREILDNFFLYLKDDKQMLDIHTS